MCYDPGYNKCEIRTINLYFQANLSVQHTLGYTMDDVATDDDDEALLDRLLAHSTAPTATTAIAPITDEATTVLRRLFGEAAEVLLPDDDSSPAVAAPPVDAFPSGAAGLLSTFETEEGGK